ncbi:hypothetical protein [Acetobacter senegalensis]|nr:hypothetical protein [Acetobacter senegalensis]
MALVPWTIRMRKADYRQNSPVTLRPATAFFAYSLEESVKI